MTDSDEMDTLLLRGAWLPMTNVMTFFEEPVAPFVKRFLATRGKVVHELTGCALRDQPVRGTLPGLLHTLEPLVDAAARRYLFVPTTSGWTAFFENNWRGTDPGSPMVGFAAAGVRSVSISYAPDTYDRRTNRGLHGSRRFEMAWPDATAPFGYNARIVGVRINDSGRWKFDDDGARQSFEEPSRYVARKIQDRVTTDMLRSYAAAIGLDPFNEQFYAPDNNGVLVQHTDPPIPGSRQFSLIEVQSGGPFELIGEPAR